MFWYVYLFSAAFNLIGILLLMAAGAEHIAPSRGRAYANVIVVLTPLYNTFVALTTFFFILGLARRAFKESRKLNNRKRDV